MSAAQRVVYVQGRLPPIAAIACVPPLVRATAGRLSWTAVARILGRRLCEGLTPADLANLLDFPCSYLQTASTWTQSPLGLPSSSSAIADKGPAWHNRSDFEEWQNQRTRGPKDRRLDTRIGIQ